MSRVSKNQIPAISITDFNKEQKELSLRHPKRDRYFITDANQNGVADGHDEFAVYNPLTQTTTVLDANDLPRPCRAELWDLPMASQGNDTLLYGNYYLESLLQSVAEETSELRTEISSLEIRCTNDPQGWGTISYTANIIAVVRVNDKIRASVPIAIDLGDLSAVENRTVAHANYKEQIRAQLKGPLRALQAQLDEEFAPALQAFREFEPELLMKYRQKKGGGTVTRIAPAEIDRDDLAYVVKDQGGIDKERSIASLLSMSTNASYDEGQLVFVSFGEWTSDDKSQTEMFVTKLKTEDFVGLTEPGALRAKLEDLSNRLVDSDPNRVEFSVDRVEWPPRTEVSDADGGAPRDLIYYDLSTHSSGRAGYDGPLIESGQRIRLPNGKWATTTSDETDGRIYVRSEPVIE